MKFPSSARPLDYFNCLARVPLAPQTVLSSADPAPATATDPQTYTQRDADSPITAAQRARRTMAPSPRCPGLPASLVLQDHLHENQGDARMQSVGIPLQGQGLSREEGKWFT